MKLTFKFPFLALFPDTPIERQILRQQSWVMEENGVCAAYWTRFMEIHRLFPGTTGNQTLEGLRSWLGVKSDLSHLTDWERGAIHPYFFDGYTPRDYQADGIRFCLEAKRVIIADTTGLGKTLQSAGAVVMHSFQNPQDTRPVLVICPAGLRYQWKAEVLKMFRHPNSDDPVVLPGDFTVIDGPPKQRAFIYKNPPTPWVVVNFELLLRDAQQIKDWLLRTGVRAMIVDESSRVSNPDSQTFTRCAELKTALAPEMVFLLNATPIENNLIDLWAQLRFVAPWIFPHHNAFESRYVNKIEFAGCRLCGKMYPNGPKLRSHIASCNGTGNKWRRPFQKITGYNHLPEVRDLIRSVYVRRDYTDVEAEIPSLVVCRHDVDMNPDQKRAYALVEADTELGSRERIMELVRRATFAFKGKDTVSSAKLDALPKILAELGDEKVVIATESKVFARAVVKRLKKDMDGSTALICGDTPAAKRQEYQNDFTKGDLRYLVGTSAIERGLNLQAAGWFVNLDLPWNPAKWLQRVGRVRRIGAKHAEIKVVNMIARDTMEERILATIYEKIGLFNAVFDGDLDEEQMAGEIDLDALLRGNATRSER